MRMENINYLTTPGAGNTFKPMWRRNGDFLSALCRWCSSPDDSLLLPWILRLYKTICARTFTGNEKPGSSRLLPSMSRFSKISNSEGRGDSSIKDPLNSVFHVLQFDANCFGYGFHHIIQCTSIQKFLSIFSPRELWIIQTWNIFFQQFQKLCTMWCVWEIACIHQCGIFFLKNVCYNELFIWLMHVGWHLSPRIYLEKNLFTLVCTIILLDLRCWVSVMKLWKVIFMIKYFIWNIHNSKYLWRTLPTHNFACTSKSPIARAISL